MRPVAFLIAALFALLPDCLSCALCTLGGGGCVVGSPDGCCEETGPAVPILVGEGAPEGGAPGDAPRCSCPGECGPRSVQAPSPAPAAPAPAACPPSAGEAVPLPPPAFRPSDRPGSRAGPHPPSARLPLRI